MTFLESRRATLKIVAAFDDDPAKANRVLNGVPCHPMDSLEDVVKREAIRIAILCVPGAAAQRVTDRLVKAGVKGILNFAPVPIRIPVGVALEEIDLTSALERVAFSQTTAPTRQRRNGMPTVKSVETILKEHPNAGRDHLIPILQEVQEAEGYLSQESITKVGKALNLPASKIFGVATFYNMFRFQPKGKYHVMVCRGTACHVKGSRQGAGHGHQGAEDRARRDLPRQAVQPRGRGVHGRLRPGAGGERQRRSSTPRSPR